MDDTTYCKECKKADRSHWLALLFKGWRCYYKAGLWFWMCEEHINTDLFGS